VGNRNLRRKNFRLNDRTLKLSLQAIPFMAAWPAQQKFTSLLHQGARDCAVDLNLNKQER
jgi:hypothetical protein